MEKKPNLIRDKSYSFALRVVRAVRHLMKTEKEFILSKQLLRSGTSVGANIAEGLQAQSKKDFISKLSIALKEAHESDYWIRLLSDSGCLTEKQGLSLQKDLDEIIRLLTAIIKTSKSS